MECRRQWRGSCHGAVILALAALSLLASPLAGFALEADDWRLPADNHVAEKMPMALVHPRPEASDWAYAKNAHPGLRWEIPVVVQGGAWPFQYSIADNGGASGLTIGAELERTREAGFIVHRVTPDYGVLSWDTPVEGEYDILVRVRDQSDNTLDVSVSLTVGANGWVFVDADHGDDANGDGSLNSPFRSVQRIHDGGADFADHRVYLSGVVAMDGNTKSGNLRIHRSQSPNTPVVWVGWPGRQAVLEAYQGKISLNAPDFYLANLEHRHAADFYQDDGSFIHMISAWSNTDRLTFHDVNFSRFHGNPVNVDWGNSSVIMFTSLSTPRQHVAVVNNRLSGDNGIFTSAYTLRHSVFEKNRAIDANFVTGEASTWAIFWIKRDNEFMTLRANEFWDNNSWGTPGNLSAAMGMDAARNIEFAYNTIHTPYDAGNDRRGAIKLFTNSSQSAYSWTADTPVWLYRNSLTHRLNYEGGNLVNMPDNNVITERNVLAPRLWPEHRFLLNIENLDQAEFFDQQMKLTGSARNDYLGRYGAELAVIDEDAIFSDRFQAL